MATCFIVKVLTRQHKEYKEYNMAKQKINSCQEKASSWNGNMTTTSVSTALQTVASQVLPTTPVNHKYLVIANFEFSTGGGTGCEFYGTIMLGATGYATQYVNSTTGDYITPTATHTIISASSGTVYFKVSETTGPRGVLVNRSTWSIIDLGVA